METIIYYLLLNSKDFSDQGTYERRIFSLDKYSADLKSFKYAIMGDADGDLYRILQFLTDLEIVEKSDCIPVIKSYQTLLNLTDENLFLLELLNFKHLVSNIKILDQTKNLFFLGDILNDRNSCNPALLIFFHIISQRLKNITILLSNHDLSFISGNDSYLINHMWKNCKEQTKIFKKSNFYPSYTDTVNNYINKIKTIVLIKENILLTHAPIDNQRLMDLVNNIPFFQGTEHLDNKTISRLNTNINLFLKSKYMQNHQQYLSSKQYTSEKPLKDNSYFCNNKKYQTLNTQSQDHLFQEQFNSKETIEYNSCSSNENIQTQYFSLQNTSSLNPQYMSENNISNSYHGNGIYQKQYYSAQDIAPPIPKNILKTDIDSNTTSAIWAFVEIRSPNATDFLNIHGHHNEKFEMHISLDNRCEKPESFGYFIPQDCWVTKYLLFMHEEAIEETKSFKIEKLKYLQPKNYKSWEYFSFIPSKENWLYNICKFVGKETVLEIPAVNGFCFTEASNSINFYDSNRFQTNMKDKQAFNNFQRKGCNSQVNIYSQDKGLINLLKREKSIYCYNEKFENYALSLFCEYAANNKLSTFNSTITQTIYDPNINIPHYQQLNNGPTFSQEPIIYEHVTGQYLESTVNRSLNFLKMSLTKTYGTGTLLSIESNSHPSNSARIYLDIGKDMGYVYRNMELFDIQQQMKSFKLSDSNILYYFLPFPKSNHYGKNQITYRIYLPSIYETFHSYSSFLGTINLYEFGSQNKILSESLSPHISGLKSELQLYIKSDEETHFLWIGSPSHIKEAKKLLEILKEGSLYWGMYNLVYFLDKTYKYNNKLIDVLGNKEISFLEKKQEKLQEIYSVNKKKRGRFFNIITNSLDEIMKTTSDTLQSQQKINLNITQIN